MDKTEQKTLLSDLNLEANCRAIAGSSEGPDTESLGVLLEEVCRFVGRPINGTALNAVIHQLQRTTRELPDTPQGRELKKDLYFFLILACRGRRDGLDTMYLDLYQGELAELIDRPAMAVVDDLMRAHDPLGSQWDSFLCRWHECRRQQPSPHPSTLPVGASA